MKKIIYSFVFLILIAAPLLGRVTYYGNIKQGGIIIARTLELESALFENSEINTDGQYIIAGFDRDDTGTKVLQLKYKDGSRKEKIIELSERDYHVQHIRGLQEEYVLPPAAYLARIRKEREEIQKAIKKASLDKSAHYASGFIRPVKGGRITSVFGSKRVLNDIPRAPHNGVDIAVAEGTSVKAMADGVVMLTGNFYFGGKYIMLSHGQGLVSFYMHLSRINVEKGQEVKKEDKIGEIGMTGRATGPHLHWGVQWKNKRIDPMLLLDTGLGEYSRYRIKVNISGQELQLYEENEKIKTYPVSTSKYGTGNESGSYKTPTGLHRIETKIGGGAPVGTIFRGRVNTGQTTDIYYDKKRADGDYILTRIMRLSGLEPGINKGNGIDSYDRYIYIHGTKEEGLVGEPVSKGCIRMKNKDIIELYDLVEEGSFVEIVP